MSDIAFPTQFARHLSVSNSLSTTMGRGGRTSIKGVHASKNKYERYHCNNDVVQALQVLSLVDTTIGELDDTMSDVSL